MGLAHLCSTTTEAATLVAAFDEACPERSRRVGTKDSDAFGVNNY